MVGIAVPSMLDVADRELVLQICGSTRHGQIVRLKSSKCTIGSGPRCTLRLRAREVGPLHCLILRGAAGTVIRCLAPDTRLNGRAFTDAELLPGDRLGIGPIELEVLEAGKVPDRRPFGGPQTCEPRATVPPPKRRIPDDLTVGLSSASRDGHVRARRLIQELRAAREQIARLEKGQQEKARDARDLQARKEDLDRRQVELGGLAAQLDRQQRALQEQEDLVRQQEVTLKEQSDQIKRSLAQQDAAEKRLQARSELLDERSKRLEAQSEQFDARQAELDARQLQLDAKQADLAAHNADLDAREAELDDRRAELDAGQLEFNQKWRQLDDERAALDASRDGPAGHSDQPQDVRFDEPSHGSPESSEEVLRRLGIAAPSLNDDEADDRPLPPAEPIPAGTAETPGSPPETAAGEDESIDDYMARLLERVRETTGRSDEPMASRPSYGTAMPRGPSPASSPEPAESPPQPPPPPEQSRERAEIAPRAVAPEKSVDLTAMRELANFSARTAINRHTRRVLFSAVARRLLVTIVGLAGAAILMWVWWTRSHDALTLYAALASFVVALFWGLRYVVMGGYKILTEPGRVDWKRKMDTPAAGREEAEQDAAETS